MARPPKNASEMALYAAGCGASFPSVNARALDVSASRRRGKTSRAAPAATNALAKRARRPHLTVIAGLPRIRRRRLRDPFAQRISPDEKKTLSAVDQRRSSVSAARYGP